MKALSNIHRSTNQKEYDDKYSHQFDRSRIDKELHDFYNYTNDSSSVVSSINDPSKANSGFSLDFDSEGRNKTGSANDYYFTCNTEQREDFQYEIDQEVEEDDDNDKKLLSDDLFSILEQEAPPRMVNNINEIEEKNLSCYADENVDSVTADDDIDSVTNEDSSVLLIAQENSSQASKVDVKIEEAVNLMDEFSIVLPEISIIDSTHVKQMNDKFLCKEENKMELMPYPPREIQIVNEDLNISVHPKMEKAVEVLDCISQISYDDDMTITPSILFFLGTPTSERELQNKEGFVVAGDETKNHYGCSSLHRLKLNHPQFHRQVGDTTTSDSISNGDDTKTTRDVSLASSNYTNASPKVLELRERKRLMEHQFETRYRFRPSIFIEVLFGNS